MEGLRMNICFSCDYPTSDFTYIRQRIICRRCWELMGRDEVIVFTESAGRNFGEEE